MNRPLQDKIGTNYAPLDAEIVHIKQLLVDPCAEIQRIDDEIAQLQARRLKLSTYVSEYTALISPMRRLPSDIVREIFISCLPANHNPIISAEEAPLLLTRVCSIWRSIALSTPRMWAAIHIVEPRELDPQVQAGCLDMVNNWLGRSGGLPLSISFHPIIHVPAVSSLLFDVIMSFSSRWKDISVSGPSNIRLSKAQVPLLRSISIADHEVVDEILAEETQGFFRGASVEEVRIGTNIHPRQLSLPWHQLTTLSLSNLPYYNGNFHDQRGALELSSSIAFGILSECHVLRKCSLQLSVGVEENAGLFSSVELPFLYSLEIRVATNFLHENNPLDGLRVPQLSEFTYTGHAFDFSGNFPFPTLISTATKLQAVKVETTLFPPESFTPFLRQLAPSLKTLCLRQSVMGPGVPSRVNSDVLLLLTPQPDGFCVLFPKLQSIEFDHASGFSDYELLAFISARMRVHSTRCLRRVKAKFFRHMESNIRSQLKPFIEEFDLAVSLNYINKDGLWNPRLGL
ncbi:hypothetical protein C8R43DRAFT_1014781 [Mycena crocata]|nr:hypothetical protein C8R43DRAFT_1014781 [Mycena crocata]